MQNRTIMKKKNVKHTAFANDYWEHCYSEPHTMDCIGNSYAHVNYLKNLFDMEFIEIKSVVDLGMGLGHFFEEVLKTFTPKTASAIEPSDYPYAQFVKRFKLPEGMNTKSQVNVEQIDLVTWAKKNKVQRSTFDLGICTSVFQYMSEAEIDIVLPILKQKVKYLYFTVPTDKELKRGIVENKFRDPWAKSRTKKWYYEKLSKHFTFVSSRLLESKYYFDDKDTLFTNLLYRF
jgi:hypothetical protein